MKKLLTLALLTISFMVNAQNDQFLISATVDPVASEKEGGLNFATEIEYTNKTIYTKAGFQSFSALEGAYTDIVGGLGLNKRLGMFEKLRPYAGVRLGFIFRGLETYPLAGVEAGIDIKITDKFGFRYRATGDYRSDFDFWGGEAKIRWSSYLGVYFKI